MYEDGQLITCDEPIVVHEIDGIITAKWDGNLEAYVVCSPAHATCYLLRIQDNKFIAIDCNCRNKEIIIDII